MRYSGAYVAVLVAAVTFSLTTLERTARASEAKPAAGSMMGANTILRPPANFSGTLTFNINRYGKRTLLQAWTEYLLPPACTQVSMGEWKPPAANIVTKYCDKNTTSPTMKCGKVTFGTITGKLGNGDCPDTTFTFAAIYYKWEAHNNQSVNASAPPNTVTDTFNARWTTPDKLFREAFTFNINVPVVRPDHETTAFASWPPAVAPRGTWTQTLVPPSSDPTFDFSGECVQEFNPGGPTICTLRATCPDKCWFPATTHPAFLKISGGTWAVGNFDNYTCVFDNTKSAGTNIWGYDYVGRAGGNVTYYRAQSPTLKNTGSCGTTFGQRMEIHAPSDPAGSFTPYGNTNTGNINTLGASETLTTVTSIRAGVPMTETWP